MVQSGVQYVTTSDGVSIAYATFGEGYPVVYLPGPPFNHIQQEWLYDNYRNYNEAIGRGRRLVRFDSRGSGLSDRNIKEFTLDGLTMDIEAVVERLHLDKFILIGTQAGGPLVINYAARNLERISHLVLIDSYASGESFMAIPQVRGFLGLMESDWMLFTDSLAHFFFGFDAGEPARIYAEFLRTCVDAEQGIAFFHSVIDWDVIGLLPTITAPTIVAQHSNSVIPNMETARFLASRLPNAELVVLEGWWNAAGPDAQSVGEILDRMTGTHHEYPQPAPTPTPPPAPAHTHAPGLVTILFTDIEGSTSLTQRIGDAAAQEIVRTHNDIVRDALRANGGTETKHTGDGIMASFPLASGAIEAAIDIQRAVAAHNEKHSSTAFRVRVGLNAGEPVMEDQDMFGTAVQLARRVCDAAQPGMILVTDVVRQLAAGKRFLFADTGETSLRGFEDPVRLYEVKWTEG